MNLHELKIMYLKDRSQFVLFDIKTGETLDSCNTIFSIEKGKEIYSKELFLESMKMSFEQSDVGEVFLFPCMSLHSLKNDKRFDFRFKIIANNKMLWIIEDFSEHYAELFKMQQERNDLAIRLQGKKAD